MGDRERERERERESWADPAGVNDKELSIVTLTIRPGKG